MKDPLFPEHPFKCVTNFQDLISSPFQGDMNAVCWKRELIGNFAEITKKVQLNGNITEIDQDELLKLQLSEQGQLAREIILSDFNFLKTLGASPVLNMIKYYETDDSNPFFPTDVYSFHVDHSPLPTDTFLCTYYGESSEILPNAQGKQKVLIPEIRAELLKQYGAKDDAGFESFLTEHFYDLHYQANVDAHPISLGRGNLWRLAVDHPDSKVSPCIHRAPKELLGQLRLLMIC